MLVSRTPDADKSVLQPARPSPALVVFDLGGTTIYDRGEVPAAFGAALREAGIVLDAGELKALRGASKYEALRRLLEKQGAPLTTLNEIYAHFQTGLIARLANAQPVSLPGVRRVFEQLHDAGILVALASGFDRTIMERILRAVDWCDLPDARVCSDDVVHGRPAPDMIFRAMERTGMREVERVAVVGDTVRDLEAGWNAGARHLIGVLTGAHDRATLSAGPHTHILDSVNDVPALWLGTG